LGIVPLWKFIDITWGWGGDAITANALPVVFLPKKSLVGGGATELKRGK
jgi:hypothetical protein